MMHRRRIEISLAVALKVSIVGKEISCNKSSRISHCISRNTRSIKNMIADGKSAKLGV